MGPKTMYRLTYGLFVLTARHDGRDSGCIINTAGQVTSTPNRISIAVNKDNFTHDLVKASGKFNISILSEEADFDLFRHFGFQSGRTVDKFTALQSSSATLTVALYVYANERGETGVAFAIAAILMVLTFLINLSANYAGKKLKKGE